MSSNKYPAELGYYMPAEWSKHSGTLLSWPANRETWPDEDRMQRVENVFIKILSALARFETVHLILSNPDAAARAKKAIRKQLPESSPVIFHEIPGNDLWARDFGPIFIRNNKTGAFALTNWDYNAWGGKYPPYEDDNAVPEYFARKYGIPSFTPGMVLEGGSIETNGNGVMLTTESVLLNPNRNPGMNKQEIESSLNNWLGQEKIIWLVDGLAGDDTDGHIDDLSRFVDPQTIFTMICDDPKDVNYEALQKNLEILKAARDQKGNPFKIETIPMPVTRIEGTTVDGSEFVPASYANFYFCNGAVLLPVYDVRYDQDVIRLFKKYCPDREIIPIPCADLVWGQGSIHCITQQLYGVG